MLFIVLGVYYYFLLEAGGVFSLFLEASIPFIQGIYPCQVFLQLLQGCLLQLNNPEHLL